MDSSRDRIFRALYVAAALALTSCVGNADGVGSVTGTLVAPSCNLDEPNYSLDPNFFGADPTNDFLAIRIDHGSLPIDVSDGILVAVSSASEIAKSHLGEPIPISVDPNALVRVSILLGETCPNTRTNAAVSMSATSGSVTFTAIYAQELSKSDRLIEGTFDAHFEAAGDPSTYADLVGNFHFLFSRGKPVQIFP